MVLSWQDLPLEVHALVVESLVGVRELCAFRAVSRLGNSVVSMQVVRWLAGRQEGVPQEPFSRHELGFLMRHVAGMYRICNRHGADRMRGQLYGGVT